MFWSFEMTQLLAKDRISRLQREAERERLARQAATSPSSDGASAGLRSSAGRAEAMPPLWPRDRLMLGLKHTHPLSPSSHCDGGEE